ncbi:response regulator [Brevundimonas sp. 3P9-tot-E]|jgi:two-component system response regulator FixJ|uniref:response regulator transcription factor n=1 Tax=Brevundimonas TaxID=41275 RepID=UPI0019047222|nr:MULTISPECIES: response regulator [Brevundimonas]MBK1969905.1 response regulator [Brevundimonas diminuta]MBK1976688.1 response regulator [Brevundimonas diminuta]MDA0744560.1 response regulator [Pseudomonadota bacterium]MDM8353140.1 response regulator [Brevundimonas diminuta]
MSRSVFVIDDDPAVRDSLLTLLRADGVRARGFAGGIDFFAALPEDAAACVVTDVRMPGMDGAEVVRRLIELRGNAWPVIVITGHADVTMAVQMMKTGIVDFIEKPFDPERLIEAVRACLNRLDDLDVRQQARQSAQMRLGRLTPRERQVFDALIAGLSNKEIALNLKISPRTVEVFRAKVMAKMEADSLSALVRMGLMLS